MNTVCWVLPDIGHYHKARMDAAARQKEWKAVVLELYDQSGFSEFKTERSDEAYATVTLFPGKDARALDRRQAATALKKGLQEIHPDVVCINGWAHLTALATLQWATDNRVPAILFSESQAVDHPRSRWKEALKSRVVRLCSAALVGGKPHVEYLKLLGMRPERIFTGYDEVDNEYFSRGAAAARDTADRTREELSLPGRYILASGQFIHKKNFTRLFEAYNEYRTLAKKTPWKLLVLGDGPLREDLELYREELGLADDVLMPGFKPYHLLPSYYGLAEAFVHASITEQWGLVVNEAMAAGLPVIVSERCGCCSDLVEDGRNGYSFDPYDTKSLASLMLKTAEGEFDLQAMGKASEDIISRWTPQTFATNLAHAVRAATEAPCSKTTLADRILLWSLTSRSPLNALM